MPISPDPDQRVGVYRDIRWVTVVGAVVDLILAVAKLVGGVLVQSQALIADGIHSLSDLATDALVIVAARQASFEADREHPFPDQAEADQTARVVTRPRHRVGLRVQPVPLSPARTDWPDHIG